MLSCVLLLLPTSVSRAALRCSVASLSSGEDSAAPIVAASEGQRPKPTSTQHEEEHEGEEEAASMGGNKDSEGKEALCRKEEHARQPQRAHKLDSERAAE